MAAYQVTEQALGAIRSGRLRKDAASRFSFAADDVRAGGGVDAGVVKSGGTVGSLPLLTCAHGKPHAHGDMQQQPCRLIPTRDVVVSVPFEVVEEMPRRVSSHTWFPAVATVEHDALPSLCVEVSGGRGRRRRARGARRDAV